MTIFSNRLILARGVYPRRVDYAKRIPHFLGIIGRYRFWVFLEHQNPQDPLGRQTGNTTLAWLQALLGSIDRTIADPLNSSFCNLLLLMKEIYISLPLKTWATWQSTIDHSMDFRQSSHLWDMGTAWATTPRACNKQQTQQTATCRHLGESIII